MAFTGICDAYDAMENIYQRFLAAEGNVHIQEMISDELAETNYLSMVVLVTQTCSLTDDEALYLERLEDATSYLPGGSGSGVTTSYDNYAIGSFTNAELVGGVMTIRHNLGSTNVIVAVRDPLGAEVIGTNTVTSSNTVTVDFGGSIGAGYYTWIVLAL